MATNHPGLGHRKRLRSRFLQNGFDGFLDYEIIELLLTLGTPRRDCKQIAKEAVNRFGGLRGSLDAPPVDLQQIRGIGPSNIFGIKLFQALSERYAKEKVADSVSLTSPSDVCEYLGIKYGKKKKECFLALLLDAGNKLLGIEEISVGTVDTSLVHPREVFEQAIKKLAVHIVIAHNHPSGNLEPSKEDLMITQRLKTVGELVGINIIDHIIVSRGGYYSLKERGYLE